MKRVALSFMVLLFPLITTAINAQTAASLSTDKESYAPGANISFSGANWAPGETVTIVVKADVPGSDETLLEAAADPSGAFTATSVMPDAEAGSPYIGTATGHTSHATAQAQFTASQAEVDGNRLIDQESYWFHRITYPTGEFNPEWVRHAANQDARVPRRTPGGGGGRFIAKSLDLTASPLALSSSAFTSLGPRPLRMTGCSGCYDYGTTSGRINVIVIDPTTTTNGSVVAYAGSVGGGVWKTTNCCGSSTSWSVVTDTVLTSTTTIDSLTIDPNDHNTIYAGTGDLNYGSFSMGSQGILKSTDAGATWSVLGANVFGPGLPEPAGEFPQYQAVGKVRVDPNNSNRVVAGAKTGLYLSYDGGANWTGPCYTNGFSTMRQDITGLELTNIGGTTRIIAAVGVRGFATTVQFNLGQNGANGLYRGTMPSSGCPTDFVSIATNANGWAGKNAGSGAPYVNSSTGNQLGRIDIGVAPSNPNYIYAQVQAITANNNSGCGNTNGCQLGVWVTTDGGDNWTQMANSGGNQLRQCGSGTGSGSAGSGDYPQNWYDQAVAVDPNNPDRVFISTFEVWLATRTGTDFYDLTCGYNGASVANHVVHVDQHALAFVPGSSSMLVLGNDGGVHATTNANVAAPNTARPTWFNMGTGLNTIEFYSGDISGNFATSGAPQANGGAQDNGSMSVTFAGSPTGPVQWQMGAGGDGFYARIDPVGTGSSLRFWQGNNSGGLSRCINNCTASGASWSSRRGAWTGDTQSFILPYDLFHGGISGGDDCPAAAATGGCGHLIAGTTRVWETITGNGPNVTGGVTWYVTNNPASQNMTKQTLGNRSFINQVKYSPKVQSVAIVGTNDANVWIGFNLGTGVANQAQWVNVTGGNTVLPNRPVLGIALDPSTTTAPIGYAAVGGFNGNTPTMPGHVFRVVCNANCASFTWADKSGNLPDIPVDSIIANPNFPPQVFAGTDFGLYYTDDITANPPAWYRFQSGLPNVMIWDMQVDRGATTLSLWTRSRGAYVWPLPQTPLTPLPTTLIPSSASGTYGGTVTLSATFTSGGNPVSGKTITFTLNGNSAGTATTDANGVATLIDASLGPIGAGSYPAGARASFAGDSFYAGSLGTNSLIVDRATLDPHITASDKEYDGTTAAAIATRTLTGIIGTDDVTLTGGTATFADKNAGDDKVVTALSLSLGGATAANYQLSSTSATTTASITKRALTIAATGVDKQYDGTATAAATLSDNRVPGDILADSYASASFNDKKAGSNKPVSVSGIAIAGIDAANYTFNSSASTTANITPRPLTISATGIDKEYDGTTTAAVTLSDNRLAGDVFGDSYASAAFVDKNAGSGKIINVSGLSITGTDAGNYSFNAAAVTTANITQAPLTVTANNASRIYSYPNPPFTASYSGFKNGETLATSGVTGDPSLTTPATQTSAAGQYTIVAAAGTLASNNYAFGFVNGTLTIYLSGIIGLDSATIGSARALADSFSSSGGYPASQTNNVLILSNGPIDIAGAKIYGNVLSAQGSVLLESGTLVSGDVSAGTTITNQGTINGAILPTHPSAPLVAPDVPACSPYTSAGNWISGGKFTYSNGDLSVSSGSVVTIANGSYCFHSITLSGRSTVQITGAVTIKLTGVLNASGGSLVNTTLVPSNLQIASSYAGSNGVTVTGNSQAYLTLYAPKTGVTITGGSPLFGAVLGKTLTVAGNSQVHYDTLLPAIWSSFFGF